MSGSFLKIWRVGRWVLVLLLVAYVALVIYRIPAVGEQARTQKAVAYIHAQKITMADVMGANLPTVPSEQVNNETLAGVDANNNGIRDDVELAIFKKYPNSARIRAAELQYAQALQLELTNVFNSDTLVAAIQEEDRAYFCLAQSLNNKLPEQQTRDIEGLVLNTQNRKQQYESVYKKYMTSYGDVAQTHCDVDPKLLEN